MRDIETLCEAIGREYRARTGERAGNAPMRSMLDRVAQLRGPIDDRIRTAVTEADRRAVHELLNAAGLASLHKDDCACDACIGERCWFCRTPQGCAHFTYCPDWEPARDTGTGEI